MAQTCKQCGAVNTAEAATCCFCDARLSQNTVEKSAPPPARPKTPQTEGNLAIATDWRSEVASRLEAYRARRKRLGSANPAQPEFSFGDNENEPPEPEPDRAAPPAPASLASPSSAVGASLNRNSAAPSAGVAVPPVNVPAPETPPALPRLRPTAPPPEEHFEIDVAQPALDFDAASRSSSQERKPADQNAASSWAESVVVPVASLAQRRRAALIDVALLLFSYGAFLSLFAAAGGRFAFSKLDLAVVVSTLALFYALYVALFTFFGGSTPGMMLSHLRVVAFDGSDPTPSQLLWRSFGYLLSAGMLLFGFLAALWDEDHLTWHDRISQTYLTSADESPAAPPGQPPREDYHYR